MKRKEGNYLLIGALLILFYWVLNHFQVVSYGFHVVVDLFFPFLVGGVIAFIFNVPMRHIEKHLFHGERTKRLRRYRRLAAYLLTLLLVLLILALVILVVVPEFVATGRSLVEQIPKGINNILKWFAKYQEDYPQLWESVKQGAKLEELNWNSIIETVGGFLSNGTMSLITGGIDAVTGIVSGITSFFIGFVFSIYLLFQKEQISRQVKHFLYAVLPKKHADGFLRIASMTGNTFSNFLSGQCLEAVILGSMFWLSMTVLRLPYALLVGVVIAVTALVPIVGAFVGCVIGAFLIAMVNPMQALVFLVLFQILQQIEGNLIYPRVVGNAVGLPSIWVLVAVSVGGSLYGVMGMLTFIPITSVCYTLLGEFVHNRLKKKDAEQSESGRSENSGAEGKSTEDEQNDDGRQSRADITKETVRRSENGQNTNEAERERERKDRE